MQVHVIHSHFSYIYTNYVKCVACHQLYSTNLMTAVIYVYFWLHVIQSFQLGDNCIVFENFTAAIGDLMVAN